LSLRKQRAKKKCPCESEQNDNSNRSRYQRKESPFAVTIWDQRNFASHTDDLEINETTLLPTDWDLNAKLENNISYECIVLRTAAMGHLL
jgi:hypothetical protein